MQSVSVGELKARFSEILERIKTGEEIVISYGKKRNKVAVLLPYDRYAPKQERTLGLLKNRGKCIIHKDFKMTDEEMLIS
ncbi:MAG: type II toxin-antitoxin system Phd/YefM family antitoxin [Deltaproteobacteria bacterium]|nr:type II toxin-antitoxin system Phd/YefM family antitoxin [Deltaproteobacteria bacterium]